MRSVRVVVDQVVEPIVSAPTPEAQALPVSPVSRAFLYGRYHHRGQYRCFREHQRECDCASVQKQWYKAFLCVYEGSHQLQTGSYSVCFCLCSLGSLLVYLIHHGPYRSYFPPHPICPALFLTGLVRVLHRVYELR